MADQPGQELLNIDGVVKWFDPKKGFGFIVGPQGQDVFAHFTMIKGEGFKVLKDGSSVNYDAVYSDKGWNATRIVRKESDDDSLLARKTHARTPRR